MKREPLSNERDQDRWLGNSLRQAAPPPTDACLDAETLAAWADGGLNAQAASAAELHASTCARCMAVAATMARTAPAVSTSRAWTPARAVRWLIPLTAAATAVAIWVAVPQRSVVDDLKTRAPAAELTVPVPVPDSVPDSGSAAGSARDAAGSTLGTPPGAASRGQKQPQAQPEAQAQEQTQLRDDDLRRERAAQPPPQEFAIEVPRAALEAAPPPPAPTAPVAQAAPPAAVNEAGAKGAAEASPSLTADRFLETQTRSQPSALTAKAAVTAEAKAPKNALIRWRVIARAAIERSLDGGKTWTETSPLPRDSVKGLTVAGIRAMSDQNAIVQMSNGVEFLTSNGGMSWVQVQEK